MTHFDPDAAADPEGGIFGLPHTVEDALAVVVPVPFEATVSSGTGTVDGPTAVREASLQVDLFDVRTGRPYERGIAMLDHPEEVAAWSEEARRLAAPVIEMGGTHGRSDLEAQLGHVNALSERMNDWVYERCRELLDAGKVPFVLGGDHSVPFGAFRAYAERHPGFGVLHVDAHYDLREAYEGFTWSHASIMWNALERLPDLARIVHVGIRDLGEREHEYSRRSERSVGFLDADLATRRFEGATWDALCREIVAELPDEVYVSFDIDGLDPALCPGTGTPVPGGLSFNEALHLLRVVRASGRRLIGADLCEVAPAAHDGGLNANAGARLLYSLIGHVLSDR